MKESEIKALITLLNDNDSEVRTHVQQRLLDLGDTALPYLERAWEESFNTNDHFLIEETIHKLQFGQLKDRLTIWKENGGLDLLEGMWLVSTYQYPDLDLLTLKSRLDQLYYEAWLEMRSDQHPADQITILNHVLFNKFKFGANTKNFHSPSNSLINVVLDSKKGNPISLCVIYMLIAQKLKLPVFGVNLPNIFILTYKNDQYQFYINVFNRGLIFSRQEIDNYLATFKLKQLDLFYEPCSNLEIVKRVLRNLSVAYEKTSDLDKVEDIHQLLDIMTDGDPSMPLDDARTEDEEEED